MRSMAAVPRRTQYLGRTSEYATNRSLSVLLLGIRLTELAPVVAIGGAVGYAAVFVGFWIVFAFLAEALAGFALGRMMFREESVGVRIGALLLGALVVGVMVSVPGLVDETTGKILLCPNLHWCERADLPLVW